MLNLSFGLLSGAVLLGVWLAILHLRPVSPPPPWVGRAAHGGLGAGGLALLLAAAWQPSWPAFFGPGGGFARSGLVLLAAALPLGMAFWLGSRRLGRARDGVLVLHAFLAITGFVLLTGWYLNR